MTRIGPSADAGPGGTLDRAGDPAAPATRSTGTVARLRERLHGRLVAATLTPFHRDGALARDAVAPYVGRLRDQGAAGLAVGAHTGRGAHLDLDDLCWLVRESRDAAGLPVVAGLAPRAGHAPGPASPHALVAQAARLRDAGADALLVAPVSGASRDATVALHERLGSEVGLPLVAFVLYARASGCQYDAGTVADLLALPMVCGVKLALLDDAVACQDILQAARRTAPDALLLTGEDRMYGPSLMWGAQAGLLGIAAALPEWSNAVLDTWVRRDHSGFVAASERLDALARLTFREPIEGYVQRMAWVAAWQGILPDHVAFDAYGPGLPAAEREHLLRALDQLTGS